MEQPYNEIAEQAAAHAGISQANMGSAQAKQLQYQVEEQDKNIAEAQLEVDETLTKVYHLLKQDVLKVDPETNVLKWVALKDRKKRILTDEGVDRVMRSASSFINKETLLSNFDEATIKRRMLEFSITFTELIFLKYEIYFNSPTIQECYDILNERVDNLIEKKKMSLKLRGETLNENVIRKKVISELGNEEDELEKIMVDLRKLNLKEFSALFYEIKALVEAVQNRAWKGQERSSLRKHQSISEVIGGKQQMPQSKGWFGLGR